MTVYEAFELNRVLHSLIAQQKEYRIQTAFKIYRLIKGLDDIEEFIFRRMNDMFGTNEIDLENPLQKALFLSQLKDIETDLTIEELKVTEGDVLISPNDIEILEKMLSKTES